MGDIYFVDTGGCGDGYVLHGVAGAGERAKDEA